MTLAFHVHEMKTYISLDGTYELLRFIEYKMTLAFYVHEMKSHRTVINAQQFTKISFCLIVITVTPSSFIS